MGKCNQCEDHLGNIFESENERAKYWGLKRQRITDRINNGWTLEDALTTPVKTRNKQCEDHLGNIFKSETDRAKYWNQNIKTVYDRLKSGWTLENALTLPYNPPNKQCEDHLGNVFESEKERAKYWNQNIKTVNDRLAKGMSLEDALTLSTEYPNKQCEDHLGNVFKSETDRAKYWNQNRKTINDRLKSGWTLEEALTANPQYFQYNQCEDHLGNTFNSERERAKYWDIGSGTVSNRLAKGMSLEDALTLPLGYYIYQYKDPITGNECSAEYLCDKYDININTFHGRLSKTDTMLRIVNISIFISSPNKITINKTKYNLTVSKRIKPGKDVFECYIDNGDGTSTFKIMTYEMIDQYCLEQYKKLHNIL